MEAINLQSWYLNKKDMKEGKKESYLSRTAVLIILLHEPWLGFMLTSQLKYERALKLIISFPACDGRFLRAGGY